MTLKKDIQLATAVATAGFKLTNCKSISTHDGACWEATLARGAQKLVHVWNGGYGGPDELRYHTDVRNSPAEIKQSLAVLMALPEVREIINDHHISMLAIDLEMERCTNDEFEQQKASILAGPVIMDDEAVEITTAHLADVKDTVAKLRRNLKTRIVWVSVEGEHTGEILSVKAADTAANREFLVRREQPIAYFVADVLGTLA